MADVITNPVELGFSEFVSKLISDTFEAVITTSISQEEDWTQLNELLSQELDVFTSLVVDREMVENEILRLFPDNTGGTTIVDGAKYQKADLEKSISENPPIEAFTGYKPKSDELKDKDVSAIFEIIRVQLGQKQYDVLSRVFSRGATKVIVDAGKINAKLNFEILQVEEQEVPDDPVSDISLAVNKRIFVKRKFPGFSGLARPIEMKNVHFFVKPPTDKDPQTHQVKANVYGEVEIQFKTIS